MTNSQRINSSLVFALISVVAGGSGYYGARLSPVNTDPQARPDAFTGTDAQLLKQEWMIETRALRALVYRQATDITDLRQIVTAHNDGAWEWKQRIRDCEGK